MKRMLGLLLAMLVLFFQWGIAWGAEEGQQGEGPGQLNMEQALEIARKVLELPPDLKSFGVNYQPASQWAESPFWDFQWTNQQVEGFRHYSATIDAVTGEIINLRINGAFSEVKPNPQTKQLAKEVTRQKAQAFVKKMVGDKYNQLAAMPESPGPIMKEPYGAGQIINYRWQRVVNGIPFEDEVTAGVDAYSGKVVYYSFRWTRNLNFPKLDNGKSLADTKTIYQENVGLKLYYQRKEGSFPEWALPIRLMYLPVGMEQGGAAIDAVTGRPIHRWSGQEFEKGKLELKPLTAEIPLEPATVKKPAKPLSMEEARVLAEQTLNIPADFKLLDRRYNEGMQYKGSRIWGFTWGTADNLPGTRISVEMDKDSGEIRSYNRFSPSPGENSQKGIQISQDEAEKNAETFLKKLFPDKLSSLAGTQNLQEQIIPEANIPYNLNYIRLVKGIPYSGNNINLQINRTTGEIENLWMRWDEKELPAPQNAIPVEKAWEKFWASAILELRYLKLRSSADSSGEVRLAYVLSQEVPEGINALSGEIEPVYGNYLKEGTYTDLTGHWVNDKVLTLVNLGVLDGSGKEFAPDRAITRAEFVKLLVKISGNQLFIADNPSFQDVERDKWYYPYVETAVKSGLVEGDGKLFRPGARVTRQEMAVMLNRLIPVEQKAEGGPGLAGFKDSGKISTWARESVRRLVGLGILQGSEGKFAPTNPASRADAVSVIYAYLQMVNNP